MSEPLRTCELCNVQHLAVTFERCELFPVTSCCGQCFDELRADDEDAASGERNCPCNGYCERCTPGVGRWL